MHTAYQLKESQFSITIGGEASDREHLFPGWHKNDRLGIVVDEPFGALGASLLLQLAITAFYDVCPSRRESTLYPDIYLFHVGGRYGDHGHFDGYPPRKEVFVNDNPAEILEAINDRAITRLAVVDGPQDKVLHHFKEPASALDRITSAFAYTPSGRVTGANIEITATSKRAVKNVERVLFPNATYTEKPPVRGKLAPTNDIPSDEVLLSLAPRFDEVPVEIRDRLATQRNQISINHLPQESYRCLTVNEAIRMLHLRR